MNVEYMCSVCGKKEQKRKEYGRPDPGTCPRAKSSNRPHRWVKNREIK